MGRNGEADLDRTLPRGELSIFAATRWDMRVLISAVGHSTSTIIEPCVTCNAMIFGRILLHLVSLLVTELYTPTSPIQSLISWHFESPRSVGTLLFGTIVLFYARYERNHRART